MSATASMLASVAETKAALQVIQTALALTAWQFPASCTPTNGSYVDYLIVGCGSAGSVLANRLSENSHITVTALEQGGIPPLESGLPGTFLLLLNSTYDFGFYAQNNGYSGQNLRQQRVKLAQGKMLGGTGSLYHLLWTQPNAYDLNQWAQLIGDSSWGYRYMLKYLRKSENLLVPSIMNSSYAKYHGIDGLLKITKEPNEANIAILKALKELGNTITIDTSGESVLGYTEPLFNMADGKRQDAALACLSPIKSRPNLCLSTYSTVKKILFSGNRAIGVEMVDSGGNTYVLYANKEVIVSAGAINSPKLLMLSGIGPKSDLERLDINVIADLPVGKNLQDHPCGVLTYVIEPSNETAAAVNPHVFPIATVIGYKALDSKQTHPDYEAVGLKYPHDSTAPMEVCSSLYNYDDNICDKFYEASFGRATYSVSIHVAKPMSTGRVFLKSKNYTADPIIDMGLLSNCSDLSVLAKSMADFNKILNTKHFKSVNASLVDVGVCPNSGDDFWDCYALAMSTSMNHISCTCAMGSVLDSHLRVLGVEALRVIDSSSMPTIPSNEIYASVIALALKGADLILEDY